MALAKGLFTLALFCRPGASIRVEEVDLLAGNLSKASTTPETPPTTSCTGMDCCCLDKCGVVGLGGVEVEAAGKMEVCLLDNGYGSKVWGNTHALTQCSGHLSQYFANADKVDQNKPCCLYSGAKGWEWALQGCNALESTSDITAITGPDCAGCPKIDDCPGVYFPTMFWESASQLWARFIEGAPKCEKQVFMLVPGLEKFSAKVVEKKISFRVEVWSLTGVEKVILVTDGECDELISKICESDLLKNLFNEDRLKDKEFCLKIDGASDVPNIKTMMGAAVPINCP